MYGTKPFATLRRREIKGKQMAYVDESMGDAIVFQHGQPTSSYVWRNVMRKVQGLGRLVACDLIGMGGSDKLSPSGPDSYSYTEHRDYLFALWDSLALGDRVVFVLDDWGAALGFDWANRNRERVQGIVHMEAVALPLYWSDIPEAAHAVFQSLRSPAGEHMVLQENLFIENRLPAAVLRELSEEEMDHYRQPFRNPGEDRRPTLSWPRNLPLDGKPADVVAAMNDYIDWLTGSDVPKLFINGEPGAIVRGRIRDAIRSWRNQREVTVEGRKLLQEDSPEEIAAAITEFVNEVRRIG
jgi:haloalkane dehalogenase